MVLHHDASIEIRHHWFPRVIKRRDNNNVTYHGFLVILWISLWMTHLAVSPYQSVIGKQSITMRTIGSNLLDVFDVFIKEQWFVKSDGTICGKFHLWIMIISIFSSFIFPNQSYCETGCSYRKRGCANNWLSWDLRVSTHKSQDDEIQNIQINLIKRLFLFFQLDNNYTLFSHLHVATIVSRILTI